MKAMNGNRLYPVFLRLEKLHLLVVGGGAVAAEKLRFIYNSSPNAQVNVIARQVNDEVKELCGLLNAAITIKEFEAPDADGFDIIIAATDSKAVNYLVWQTAKKNRILINVADTPELCDFYLGGIVTKGDLKIAISTNGKSPTMAKRIRQFLEETLPDELNDLIQNMHTYRQHLKGDFSEKVAQLNKLTATLLQKD